MLILGFSTVPSALITTLGNVVTSPSFWMSTVLLKSYTPMTKPRLYTPAGVLCTTEWYGKPNFAVMNATSLPKLSSLSRYGIGHSIVQSNVTGW